MFHARRLVRAHRRHFQAAYASLSTETRKVLRVDSMNPNVVAAEYAVRGEIVLKSVEYEKMLREGVKLPFDEIIACNIGNPHSLKQKPITFNRQVLSLVNFPQALDDPDIEQRYPVDVIERARQLVASIPSGVGAYSESKGIGALRETVADFIERRDGYPTNPENIFLTDGASPAVQMCMNAMITQKSDAIMVPLPQYPLYSAGCALYGGSMVGYYLDEDNGWSMERHELERALQEARSDGLDVRALVVINPGNPTGNCLSVANMKDVVKFCEDRNLILLADEVYQENIWHTREPWQSFKKVASEMDSDIELASFHSISKGFVGECGRRGGYVELCNFDPAVVDQLYKIASISLCSNVEGQIMTSLMTNPPKPGDPSYQLYVEERDDILQSLKRRAKKLVAAYNQMEGMTCNEADGALYTFPRIRLSQKAIDAALAAGKSPDTFYCLAMLAETGIVVVPGSGFGQVEGTWHFRATILPSEDQIESVIERTSFFHAAFMDRYRD